MLNLKSWAAVAAAALTIGLAAATPAVALSSGSSGGSSLGSSDVLSSGSSVGSLSSGESLLSSAASSLMDRIFPETEEEYLNRITNPVDDSYIALHPAFNEDLYNAVYDPPQVGECPAVTVIAARGSGQNMQIRPTRYSQQAPWTSNGFEERNIRALFARLEQQHVRETGQSLMKDVYVMGLTDIDYPALLPLSSDGSTVVDFGSSLIQGRENVLRAIDRFETETGCQSSYLLVGYSQGVLVMEGQEQELIDSGQYAGSLLIANPSLRAGDPTIIGHQSVDGGLLSSLEDLELLHPNKINYCLPGDVVCDRDGAQFSTSGSSIAAAQLSTGNSRDGRVHLQYFVTRQPWDQEIFNEVAGWITDAVTGTATGGEPTPVILEPEPEETQADILP